MCNPSRDDRGDGGGVFPGCVRLSRSVTMSRFPGTWRNLTAESTCSGVGVIPSRRL
ncbi:hypothetical protein ACFPRL_20235 [Pseudoclavibacter helvolus]